MDIKVSVKLNCKKTLVIVNINNKVGLFLILFIMKGFCLGNISSSIQALIYTIQVSNIKLQADMGDAMIS